MKISLKLAENLYRLMEGETLPKSSVKGKLIETLIQEKIIYQKGRIQKSLLVPEREVLENYLANKYAISNLSEYIETLKKEEITRAELAKISSDSKLKNIRTFKGFLINFYDSFQAQLNGKTVEFKPLEGTFQFITDFESFYPDKDMIIVGIENAENFRKIQLQKHLFEDIKPLFVSRYPQNQSKDLITWLNQIPNPYLHFGDFDLAGINIFINEFRNQLSKNVSFFIPEDIEELFDKYGNSNRYDVQNQRVGMGGIDNQQLKELIELIHKTRKGVDQEVLIGG